MFGASFELNSLKLEKTNIHESYFRLYMQLNLFLIGTALNHD